MYYIIFLSCHIYNNYIGASAHKLPALRTTSDSLLMTPGTISICEKLQFQAWFSYMYYADAHFSKSLPKITVVQHY